MKTILLGLCLLGFAGTALAIEPSELDARIVRLTGMFTDMQSKPDKSIPPDMLQKAQGIVLLDRTKAGFLFAYQGGVGVALVRDPVTKKWSAPAFLSANEASIGIQVGGEKAFYAILFMSTNATHLLLQTLSETGSEAHGTVGNVSGTAHSSAPDPNDMVVYDDRRGFFGGADLKIGALAPDHEANLIYYGKPVTMWEILLEHKVNPTDSGIALAKLISDYSKASEVSQNDK